MDACTYENDIKALWENYLKTDTIDQELLKNIVSFEWKKV